MAYDVTKHQSVAKSQRFCFTKSRVSLRIYLYVYFFFLTSSSQDEPQVPSGVEAGDYIAAKEKVKRCIQVFNILIVEYFTSCSYGFSIQCPHLNSKLHKSIQQIEEKMSVHAIVLNTKKAFKTNQVKRKYLQAFFLKITKTCLIVGKWSYFHKGFQLWEQTKDERNPFYTSFILDAPILQQRI